MTNFASNSDKKNVKRISTIFAFALVSSVVGLGAVVTEPASASCYGSGYSRYCDGVGGPGATYSSRGDFGSTTYSDGSSQTYSTYYY
ncbi:hypothetical protein [Prochlorococcus sp. MIT 1307]|uniref:hypothetical protein n=1 Tax=Prochlorococcus sp. MIT 1307 TaxID=3096219 RepID=UPI002A749414|nr:hypothetical protein [Prochlorococcus sp. MIT 1307]